MTEEEKKEKARKLEIAVAKAKEILKGYVKRHKALFLVGFVLNVCGMVGEFVTPLFIGKIVDAIVGEEYDKVNELIV